MNLNTPTSLYISFTSPTTLHRLQHKPQKPSQMETNKTKTDAATSAYSVALQIHDEAESKRIYTKRIIRLNVA